jgi:hypothetical protein
MLLPEYHYMSSSDRLNPQQLQMFMPARELHTNDKVSLTEMQWVDENAGEHKDWQEAFVNAKFSRQEEPEQMWDRKLTESKRSDPLDISRHEQVSRYGILRPVVLTDGGTKIRDGHHRVAIANDLDPDTEVPVEYKERSEAHDFVG